jgi:C1A family cysteine protease
VARVTLQGTDCYKIWNSWGTGWGDQGFGYIPCDALAAMAFDLYGMVSGPVL